MYNDPPIIETYFMVPDTNIPKSNNGVVILLTIIGVIFSVFGTILFIYPKLLNLMSASMAQLSSFGIIVGLSLIIAYVCVCVRIHI